MRLVGNFGRLLRTSPFKATGSNYRVQVHEEEEEAAKGSLLFPQGKAALRFRASEEVGLVHLGGGETQLSPAKSPTSREAAAAAAAAAEQASPGPVQGVVRRVGPYLAQRVRGGAR